MKSWSLLFLFWCLPSWGQIYGPQVEEFNFRLRAKFESKAKSKAARLAEAENQISHLFGLFQSPAVIREYGLLPSLVGGLGAIQYPVKIDFKKSERLASGRKSESYVATGRLMLHQQAAKLITSGKEFALPLPVQLDGFYDKDCTDKEYFEAGDFFYFFDSFRSGCEHLRQPPLADNFVIELTPGTRRDLDVDMRLDLLRGNNGNGAKFRIDVVHGYSDSSSDPRDLGRKTHAGFHKYLERQNFTKKVVRSHFNRPLMRFTKTLTLHGGSEIEVEINSLLVDTDADSKSITFAKFFKAAVAEADVVYYEGHSGLGGNLNIPYLESKAGGFRFNQGKRQIFYFDSCSSYSYYLYPFRAEKTRARLDVVTNGLSSYFETGLDGLVAFLEIVLDPTVEDHTWPEALDAVEATLDGQTYLVNVGGL